MRLLLLCLSMHGSMAWLPTKTTLSRRGRFLRSKGCDGDDLSNQVKSACLALAILASAPVPPSVAYSNDFAGVPVEKKAAGLRNKNGNTAAPSESGLGLFVDKNGPSLLRLALADVDVNAREVQANLELITLRLSQVGFSGKTPIWKAAAADTARAEATLKKYKDSFVSQSGNRAGEAQTLLEQVVEPALAILKDSTKEQDYSSTADAQVTAAEGMAKVRELMAANKGFAAAARFEVPAEFASLPRLEGRASVDLTFKAQAQRGKGAPPPKVTVVVDGYHAPLASGAFVAQAAQGGLDGVKVAYNEELIVGMSAPNKPLPAPSGSSGSVPLELFYRGDGEPTYGVTQDDDGRGSDTQVLPFQAYGALGMSHPDEDVDGNTNAQFFFVKYDQSLLPPGRNTLDGAYTCFGYTVAPTSLGGAANGGLSGGKGEGGFEGILSSLKSGDVIETATVVSGLENLKNAPTSK